MKSLISIIVPVYNVEKQLILCIDSLINQTYKNIEIILIDDGSTDKSKNICDEYGKKDKRIKIIHKRNGGLSDARNKGIDIAKGEYILFVDSDDYVSNDIVELLYNNMIENECEISTCSFIPFYEGTKPDTSANNNKEISVFNTSQALEALLYQKNCTTSAWAKLYKTSLFKDIRYPLGKIHEDLPITYILFSKSKKIVISQEKKYYYLLRKNSITGSDFNEKKIEVLDFAAEETRYICNNYPEIIKAAYNREFMEAIYTLLRLKNTKKYKDVRNRVKLIIKKYRMTIITDKKATKISKIYALSSFLGINNIYKFHKLYQKVGKKN